MFKSWIRGAIDASDQSRFHVGSNAVTIFNFIEDTPEYKNIIRPSSILSEDNLLFQFGQFRIGFHP
jgi:hypothetical protein